MSDTSFLIVRDGQSFALTSDELQSAYELQNHMLLAEKAMNKVRELCRENGVLYSHDWAFDPTGFDDGRYDAIFSAMADDFENMYHDGIRADSLWDDIIHLHIHVNINRNAVRRILLALDEHISPNDASWEAFKKMVTTFRGNASMSQLFIKLYIYDEKLRTTCVSKNRNLYEALSNILVTIPTDTLLTFCEEHVPKDILYTKGETENDA